MLQLATQIAEAADAVRNRWVKQPRAGIILGSGLGDLVREIEVEETIDYSAIPGFPKPTALGHAGKLVCGLLSGKPVVAFQGRFHLYEGHSAEAASLLVRLVKALGGDTLVVSNAAGGLNPQFAAGDVMLIDDHVNLLFANPLIGINDDSLGPRFPDMSAPYDKSLQQMAQRVAVRSDFTLHRGTYIAVLGPNYETRAEIRMLRLLGDAVGMSTVPEVIAAQHAGLRALGLSTITNVCSPDVRIEASGHDVIAVATAAAHKLSAIVRGVIAEI